MMAAPLFARGQDISVPTAPQDDMAERVLACAPCHGAHGQGTGAAYFPRLAGKPQGYLFNQLAAFRSGRRPYPPMHYLLAYMSDAYLEQIAAYFARQSSPPLPAAAPTASDAVLARGRTLVSHGDPARGVPACIGCHGPAFGGMEPAIPGLIGLRQDYISAQLGAWRYGTRTAPSPDCMQIVAGHLSEADVTAVAAWLATLHSAVAVVPLKRGALAMPLACGSEPS
jgi:cytochrome c553